MDCRECEELLSLYLEDQLAPDDRISIEKHLRSCPTCLKLHSLLKETGAALKGFPEVDISHSLLERLYETPAGKRKFSFSPDFLLRPALQPVLAAASIILILVSFYMFHPDKNVIDKTINREIHRGYSKIGQLYTKAESFALALFDQKDTLLDSLKNSKIIRGKEE